MKKVLTILAIAAALSAVSCTKELERSAADSSTVTFTVDAGQISTRAVSGTHGTATRLQVGVYLKGTGETYSYIEAISQSNTVSEWPTVVSLELARNETYKIVFWADEGTDAYTINWTNGTVAETANTIDGNAVNRDAYYKLVEITPSGSTGESITLVRPLAQVNVGTNDLAAYKAAAAYNGNIETQVVINGVAPGINLLTGEATAGEPVNLTFSYTDNMDATLTSSEKDYSYLGMKYILCPADNTLTAQIALRKDDAAENINSFTVSNMPVKPNYRTNVVGKLLTGTVEYTVDVDTNFNSDLEKNATPVFASIAALNTFFASKIATGPNDPDHGDIYPESVTVTAIPDGDATTITLPNDTLSVAITILDSYSAAAGLTIAYPTAEGAKHSNKVFFNMSGLSKLTANLPDTHLEIVSGSDIDLSDVHTSAGTFVVQKNARVGMLNINQGNAEIAGAVENLYVIENATSDGEAKGESNAVQVFLSSESAVEKIHLASRSDVVVEQPKDQIEVEATEKKVAVYVNSGANNSTAKAQNGGVIYVKAEVPCTVTADGTSKAEDGSAASSTVIIESGAAGSSVVAENGASVDLTANGNCVVSASGASEATATEEAVPSSVTIEEVSDGVNVYTETEGGATIAPAEGADIEGDISAYVAKIVGGEKYVSLYDAVAAAEAGATVEMINNSTETSGFTLTKSLTIDLCNYKVTYDSGTGDVDTNKYPNSRAIKVGGSEAISVTVENGTIVVGNNVYGPFRIENANANVVLDKLTLNNSMAYGLGTKIVDAHSVVISNTVVNSVVGGGIEKGCDCPTILTNVTVNQTEEDTQHPWISTALSTEYGGPLTVESGSYSGKVAAYLFSSGGTMNINGGSFTGNEAAIRVQNNTQESGWVGPSTINISGGTFVGPLILDAWGNATPVPSSVMNISGGSFTTTSGQGALFQVNGNYSHLTITGGTFSEDPSAYVAEGYCAIDNGNGTWTVKPDGVAAIGNVFYHTLAEAVSAAQADETVTMVDNTVVSSSITLQRNLTLDLNGKTITSSAVLFNIYANCALTITDSGVNGAIDVTNSKIVYSSGGGTVTLAGGALSVHSSSTFTYGIHVGSGSNFVMTGGSITIPDTSTSTYNYCISNSGNGTTTISGGSLIAEASGGNYAVQLSGGGTTNISGGTVVAKAYPAGFKSPYTLYNTGGTLNVSGGYFKALGDKDTYSAGHLVEGTASISGGYFGGNYYYSLGSDQIASGYNVRTLDSSESDATDAAAYSSGYKFKVEAE